MSHHTSDENAWKGLVLGLVGGAAGLLAMRFYWNRLEPLLPGQEGNGRGSDEGEAPAELEGISLVGKQYRGDESSTAALGRLLYTEVSGSEPNKELKEALSYLVHWGYGVAQGGVYGVTHTAAGGLDPAGGMLFGAGLWLLGDELIVPLLGLQGGPTSVSGLQHLHRLGAHLAYGLATALTTQTLRRLM
ncbi:MAG: hypothetical protein ACRDHL_09235 [Candidatus Promineifilaceae bacterium]